MFYLVFFQVATLKEEVETLKAQREKVNSSMKDIIHGAEGYKVSDILSCLFSVIFVIQKNFYVKHLFILSKCTDGWNLLYHTHLSVLYELYDLIILTCVKN